LACLPIRPRSPYQLRALIQAIKDGKDRFLFEVTTGTSKTLIAAAVEAG
jgi:type I restriction enzyme, R subunit